MNVLKIGSKFRETPIRGFYAPCKCRNCHYDAEVTNIRFNSKGDQVIEFKVLKDAVKCRTYCRYLVTRMKKGSFTISTNTGGVIHL